MDTEKLKESMNDIEDSKAQIQKALHGLKGNLSSFINDIQSLRESSLDGKSKELAKNPLLITAEFFFIGFYARKMLQLLKDASRDSK